MLDSLGGVNAGLVPVTLSDARRSVAQHLEVVVLALLVVFTVLLPKTTPLGIYGLGLVAGGGLALHVLGLVLVYRSNRVINFAQVAVGTLAGVLFLQLASRGSFIVGLHYVCPSCVRVVTTTINDATFSVPVNPPAWMVQANYWLSMLAGLLLAMAVAWIAHALVIRRFTESPKLVLTLVTIGISQVCLLGAALIVDVFETPFGVLTAQPLPFEWSFRIAPVTFGTADILTVVLLVAAAGALTLFLKRSAVGVLLRGAADNPRRAQTLGANVESVTSVSWLIAAFLSSIASLLGAIALGAGGQGDAGALVRILAAAVIAGMVNLPLAVGASLVIGIVDHSVLYSLSKPAVVDALLVGVIVLVLLVQRGRATRADTEAESAWRATREARPIPQELRNLDTVRSWLRAGPAVLAVLVLGLPWALSPGQISYATSSLLFGILALSLLVLTGWAGQISLGQMGLAAVGAYVAAWSGLPFPIALLLAALAGSITAVVVGLPALRLRGLHLAITTLAFSLAVSAILLDREYLGKHLPDALERPFVLGLDLEDQRVFYYFALAFLAACVLGVMGIRRSRTARALIACRDNEALAQSFGLNLVRMRLTAFAISGFLAALAGGLFAYSQFGVQAQTFAVEESVNIFLVAVIGGMGSVAGPLIGAAYYGVVNIFAGNALVALAATGLGVIVLLIALPGGLSEGAFKIRDSLLRRLASRYRIDVPSLIADRARIGVDRVPIAPKQRPGGGKIFVPARYRLDGQWVLDARRSD